MSKKNVYRKVDPRVSKKRSVQQALDSLAEASRQLLSDQEFNELIKGHAELTHKFLEIDNYIDYRTSLTVATRTTPTSQLTLNEVLLTSSSGRVSDINAFLAERGVKFIAMAEGLPIAVFLAFQIRPDPHNTNVPQKLICIAGLTPDNRANQTILTPTITDSGYLKPGTVQTTLYEPAHPSEPYLPLTNFFFGWAQEAAPALKHNT